ncbi:MAG TPA: helix-turn-helix domain-containing protein [Ruminococcus flavefaciens]|nr:helix-turn-helix domain-containing protein [Ruminococcus flavefaciens]
MDTVMIGKFLKELRKEKGYTQETLGEKIGVTNKTVSRWETGTYMPPVECLVMLSDIYDVSINEIVAGQRLSQSEFNDKAEENLSEALRLSENEYKQREKKLTIVMAVSTIIAMVLIWLVPFNKEDMARSIVIILLIICLVFISNTLNVIALAQNKEKHEKKDQ